MLAVEFYRWSWLLLSPSKDSLPISTADDLLVMTKIDIADIAGMDGRT